MKGFNHPLFNLFLCLIMGIILQKWFIIPLAESVIIASILAFLALILHFLFRKRKNFLLSLPLYLSFIGLGILTTTINDPLNDAHHFSNYDNKDATVFLNITEVLKPNPYAMRYIGEVVQVNNQGASGRILINIPRDSTKNNTLYTEQLRVDDHYAVKTTIEQVREPRNPYQFDYAAYLADLGIHGQIYAQKDELVLINWHIRSAQGIAARIRLFFQGRLAKHAFATREWGVINALLLGQRQQLTSQTRQNYIDAGVVHILAISGLHVGIVLLLMQLLFKPLGNSRSMRVLRSVLVILGIWGFALIAGLSPSVLRAATMFSFLQIGLSTNRKSGGLNGLVASALVLLLINPSLLYQVGFQLSYAAVFFIIWLQPTLFAIWKPKTRILRYFWGIFTVTLTAQLGVLPLSLFYFHQFSSLFFVANMVVIPVLGIVLGAGILILFLSGFGILPGFLVKIYGFLIRLLNDFIFWIAGFDNLVIRHIYFSVALVLFSYLLIATTGMLLKKPNYERVMIVLSAILLLLSFNLFNQEFSSGHQFYIEYKNRSSLLVRQNNNQLRVYGDQQNAATTVNLFRENVPLETVKKEVLRNYFIINKKELLVVDSLGIYNIKGADPDYILLRQSPKINLERLFSDFPEVQIIADGSNYKSYIHRWKTTCLKEKIPFHSTYEKGTFIIK
ncbi:MAG TPA: ComEC family competence protein [Leeuwenhoekiella sp.]|nr:ComEC family competence protein [Leeuwenhoekiella sp.]